jgi:hypothetical protein
MIDSRYKSLYILHVYEDKIKKSDGIKSTM